MATIVCPPLGGALWPKKAFSRVVGVALGAIVSLCSAYFIAPIEKPIFDNPQIKIVKLCNLTNMRKACTSPLELYFFSDNTIFLEGGDNNYEISGNDVITFKDGKYNLNFGASRKFNSSFGRKSLMSAYEKVDKYKELIRAYTKKGDIFTARRARESLEKARANLESVTNEFNKTKAAFQGAVDKMNSELESLAQTDKY